MNQLEEERLRELFTYDVLDTEEEAGYSDIVKLASQICNTPISLISLLDDHRQWFKAKYGIESKETPKEDAFCAYTIQDTDILEVENASTDPRFLSNPLVLGEPNIVFYAGIPLITPNGYRLGSLCVIDRQPKKLTQEQRFALKVLSNQIVQSFELKLKNYQLGFVLQKAQDLGKIAIIDIDLRYHNWNISDSLKRVFGIKKKEKLDKEYFISLIHPQDSKRVVEAFKNALKESNRFDQKFRVLKDESNELIYVKFSVEIIKNQAKKPIKIIGIVKDLSEITFRENVLIKEIEELKKSIK